MSEIFLDPNFDPEVVFTPEHQALLSDWEQRVGYHYDLYKESAEDSIEQKRQIQYLWDLYWNFTDNFYDPDVKAINIIAMLNSMASVEDMGTGINESGELLTKELCNKYLVDDLGMPDDIYLIPSRLEYPIVDKNSVRLAMDKINSVDPEDKDLYVQNLNRKYTELGCNFTISVDHPYAKYADQNIVDHMAHMLLEGDTVVDDQGTSADKPPRSEQAWYRRFDEVRGITSNIIGDDNKELGPNTKKQQEPDYTPYDSFL